MLKRLRPLCGAQTRNGRTCLARVVWNPELRMTLARCRMHGGLSTGPRWGSKREGSATPRAEEVEGYGPPYETDG
jgi:hypothetical protein